MTNGNVERIQKLIRRNAQSRFLRELSERGRFVAEATFTFVEDIEQLLDDAAEKVRSTPEQQVPAALSLLEFIERWLKDRDEDVYYYYIRDVGVLRGNTHDFVKHAALFEASIATIILFTTPTLEFGVKGLHDEGQFIVAV